jgi:hypothetical protein
MLVNSDYSDMLSALNDAGAEYLVVGAYAMAAHGVPRATGDIDVWVKPSAENADRVWQALVAFGALRSGVSREDFATPGVVFQIGLPPHRIDLLTAIDGVDFDEAWSDRSSFDYGGVLTHVLSLPALLTNKRATGRTKDLADIEALERRIGLRE